MPRVNLTTNQKIESSKNKIRRFLKGKMAENNITMQQLGDAINTYQSQISLTISGKSDAHLLEMLIAMCSMTEISAEEIRNFMKI